MTREVEIIVFVISSQWRVFSRHSYLLDPTAGMTDSFEAKGAYWRIYGTRGETAERPDFLTNTESDARAKCGEQSRSSSFLGPRRNNNHFDCLLNCFVVGTKQTRHPAELRQDSVELIEKCEIVTQNKTWCDGRPVPDRIVIHVYIVGGKWTLHT